MMAKKNEARIRFSAETKDLTDGIARVNGANRELRSALRLVEAQMASGGESAELLQQKQALLEEQAAQTADKAAMLEAKLASAVSIFGENSVEAERLRTSLNYVRIEQEKLSSQIAQTGARIEEQAADAARSETALDKLTSTIGRQRAEVDRLEDEYKNAVIQFGRGSAEAHELESKLQRANAELNRSETEMREAERAVRELADGFDDASREARDLGGSIGDIAAGNVIADFAGNALGSLTGLEESTRQYRNEQAKLETVAIESGQSIDDLKGSYTALYAITGDETLASTAVLNMSAMGTSVEDQQKAINAATGAWAQFGDSIPIDGLMESVNESSRLGATLTGPVVDAINWANMSQQEWAATLEGHSASQDAFNAAIAEGATTEDAMNAALAACSSEQERQQLLISALDGAYGSMGETYRETNKDVIAANEAASKMADAQASIAEQIAPLQTAVTSLAADGLQFLADHMSTIAPLAAIAAGSIGALAVAMNFSTIAAAFSAAMARVGAAMTVATGPIGIAVAAVAAVAAGFVWAYKSVEPFRVAVDTLVQTVAGTALPILEQLGSIFTGTILPVIKQVGSWIMDGLAAGFTNLGALITTYVVPAISAFGDFVTAHVVPVLQQMADFFASVVCPAVADLWTWLSGHIVPVFQEMTAFVLEAVVPALQSIGDFVTSTVVPALGQLYGWFESNVLPILESFWAFVSANVLPLLSQFADFLTGTVCGALSALRGWFADSVLPAMDEVWGAVGTGLDKFGEFADGVGGFIGGAVKLVKDGLDSIAGFFKGLDISWPHIKLPHFTVAGSLNLDPANFSLPSIGVEWYAKGGIMTAPTLFGINGGRAMVGGEAGPEAVLPIERLQGFIDTAFASHSGDVVNNVTVSVTASGDADSIADAVAFRIFGAIDQAMAANGR